MAPRLPPVLSVTGIRGRNGITAPHLIPDDQCAEAVNVEFYEGGLAKKRDGVAAHGTTSLTSIPIYGLFRHVPGADQTAAEFWTVDDGAVFKRMAAGTTWATITPSPADTFDAMTWNGVTAASFNGKLFVALGSNVNRLHVWDGTTLRRVGVAPPAGASETLSAGAVVSDVRKYKAAATVEVSSVVVRRSELSVASSAVTLSNQRATMALVTAPSEGETHWELYMATDDDNYATYRYVGRAAIGSTVVDNTDDPTAYVTAPSSSDGAFEPSAGRNQLPPSCKYLATDGNRLLMAGAYESSAGTAQTTPKNSRVWFTPLLGTTGEVYHDDERISTVTGGFKSWVDVGENDGDSITGLGVLGGIVYVFKYERLYRLVPTGDPIAPYFVQEISKSIGAVSHQSIFTAEDERGGAVLCFWSKRGPYRISNAGLQYMGHDIEDRTALIDSSQLFRTWGVFHPKKRQVIWWIHATAGEFVVCDAQMQRVDTDGSLLGGWSRWSLGSTTKRACGCLFSVTPGASMSRDLTIWMAGYDDQSGQVGELDKYDSGTYTGQAYIISKTFAPTQFREQFNTNPPTLIAEVSSGVSIQGILRADFHASTDKEDTVTLTVATGLAVGSSVGSGTETRIVKRLDALEMAGMRAVAFQLGDNTAIASAWTLDSLTIPYEVAS